MNQMTRVAAAPESFKARITTAEFLRMLDADVFGDARVELINGELERMPPPGNMHGLVQMTILGQLLALFGAARVRAEQAIDLGDDTLLGCDGVVLREPCRERRMLKPGDVLLVIEVADTTLGRDKGTKRLQYAAAGVANYWVADERHGVVHVHAEPTDGDYVQVQTVAFGQPMTIPGEVGSVTLS